MYQVITHLHLCSSKKYFLFKEEAHKHISKVIDRTMLYRSTFKSKLPLKTLSKEKIIDSISLTHIDEELLPNWETVFGKEEAIRDPEL
jgi:hypothetical protein